MEEIKIQDISLWQSFYWVCKKGSFTAAAAQLHLSVPYLSKKIAQLEEGLGSRLFHRTTRRVSMTQEAKALLPRVEAFLEEAGDIERRAGLSKDPAGVVRVACVPAFAQRCLVPLLAEFRNRHPDVQFELRISDRLVDLVEEQIDVAIRVQIPTGAQFVFRKLFRNDLVWCASPEYLRAHGRIQKPADLKKHPLLTLAVYDGCRAGAKMRVGDLRKEPALRCESGAVLTELAVAGMGIALRSRWDVAGFISNGTLVELLKQYPVEPYGEVYAVTAHGRLLPQRVRLFLDYLIQRSQALFGHP